MNKFIFLLFIYVGTYAFSFASKPMEMEEEDSSSEEFVIRTKSMIRYHTLFLKADSELEKLPLKEEPGIYKGSTVACPFQEIQTFNIRTLVLDLAVDPINLIHLLQNLQQTPIENLIFKQLSLGISLVDFFGHLHLIRTLKKLSFVEVNDVFTIRQVLQLKKANFFKDISIDTIEFHDCVFSSLIGLYRFLEHPSFKNVTLANTLKNEKDTFVFPSSFVSWFLTYLNLGVNEISDIQLNFILSSINQGDIRILDLNQNRITGQTINLEKSSLRVLGLRDNPLSALGLNNLSINLRKSYVTHLILSDCQIEKVNIENLSLIGTPVQYLSLMNNGLTNMEIYKFASNNLSQGNCMLQTVEIGNNPISDEMKNFLRQKFPFIQWIEGVPESESLFQADHQIEF